MRVWIVNQYAISPRQAGGTRHYSLAVQLIKAGHEVVIIASSFDHATRRETRSYPEEGWMIEEINGVTFVWIRTPPYTGNTTARIRNMLYFAQKTVQVLSKSGLSAPDVVVGSSPHLFAALAGQRLAARLRVPFVLEVRDLWPQSLIDLGKVSRYHPLVLGLELVERFLYRSATKIVSPLPTAIDHMQLKGVPREKFTWIPNGVDRSLVPPLEKRRGDGPLSVVYAGAHGLANALDAILDAAAVLVRDGWAQKAKFCLVGDGPDKPRLMQRAQDQGLTNVVFEDPVPKNEIFQRLDSADAFIIVVRDSPLYKFGISMNKLFDYMCGGRPIIYSGNTPYNPVNRAAAGITVPPEDGSAIADAVKQIAGMSDEERLEMGRRGRQYVEEHHTFEVLAERFCIVLADAIAHRGSQ